MIFFTADLHAHHRNIIKYCQRPFDSVEIMDATLISNWNRRVSPNDTTYVIGDFIFTGKPEEFINQLNGKIILIPGGHDHNLDKLKKLAPKCTVQLPLLTIELEGQVIVLCHFPLRIWDRSHYNSWHLYGHCHSHNEYSVGKSWDCGVDGNGYAPLSWEEIKTIVVARPDNPNLIKGDRRD